LKELKSCWKKKQECSVQPQPAEEANAKYSLYQPQNKTKNCFKLFNVF